MHASVQGARGGVGTGDENVAPGCVRHLVELKAQCSACSVVNGCT